MIVLEPEGASVREKQFIQPGNIHYLRQGGLFRVINTYSNDAPQYMAAEIKQSDGSAAGADADAVETYLSGLIPVAGGGPLSGTEIAAGIIRPDGSGLFAGLNDNEHKTMNIGAVTVVSSPTPYISVAYSLNTASKKIIFFGAHPDEQFGGIGAGCKFNFTPNELRIFPNLLSHKEYRFRGSYSSSSGTWTKNASWSNGMEIGATNQGTALQVTHTDVGNLTLPNFGLAYGAWGIKATAINTTTVNLNFFDPASMLVPKPNAAPPDLTEVYITRRAENEDFLNYQIDPAGTFLQNTGGNFQFIAIIGS